MTIETPEILDPKNLLEQFKLRYEAIINENQQLTTKIKENEQTALKLLGAMETIQYLHPENSEESDDSTESEETIDE